MTRAPSPEPNRRCPRCGAPFHCGAADIGTCWCSALPRVVPLEGVRFPNEPLYEGCLCPSCLRQWLASSHDRAEST